MNHMDEILIDNLKYIIYNIVNSIIILDWQGSIFGASHVFHATKPKFFAYTHSIGYYILNKILLASI